MYLNLTKLKLGIPGLTIYLAEGLSGELFPLINSSRFLFDSKQNAS